ncbi:MAG: alcohol dehydrogenase catalytic domain-containing protein [Ignavibacteriales bacterium]|nr:alcohol dehydrogenase catalytic domain-containing protein [Ignavibacteriales bacterium]
MKAVRLKGIKQFEIEEIPKPKIIHPNDVLIKIKMVGVCGSDIHYYSTGRIGSQIVQYPFITGHEAAGIVEEVGRKVTKVKPGQRIAIDPAVSCGECDQCLSGREHTCRKLVFIGAPKQKEGALCNYVVLKEHNCFPISNNTTFEQAVLSEPLAIAVYSVHQSKPTSKDNIAILGAGPIGMSVFHVLRTQTVGDIYITDRIDDRLEFSKQLNPKYCGNPNKTNIVEDIKKIEPLEMDIVYECSGDLEAYQHAIDLLKPGGLLVIIGIPEVDEIAFPIHELRRKEITILNIRRQANSTQKAIDLLESGKIKIDNMVTHHFKMETTKEAFDLVSNYKDGVMKAMISIDC